MTETETGALSALSELLDLTDVSDWRLIHATVREDVGTGRFSPEFEKAYKGLVDAKLEGNHEHT